jgi:hypothetical protein
MSRSIRVSLRRHPALARWAATGATVAALGVAVPIVASGATGGAAAPGLSTSAASAFITAAQRPLVAGTLAEANAATTDLGPVSLWTYQVTGGGPGPEVMLSLPDHPIAFGQCPSTGSAAFCIAEIGGPGSPLIIAGTASANASSVVASLADGTTVSGPVENRTWIMQLPGSDAAGIVADAPRSFTTYASSGAAIGTSNLGVPSLVADHNAAAG